MWTTPGVARLLQRLSPVAAAIALGDDLPLFTRNPDDVDHLEAVGLALYTV